MVDIEDIYYDLHNACNLYAQFNLLSLSPLTENPYKN